MKRSTKADLRQRLLEFGQRVTGIYATSHLHALGAGRLTQRLANFLRIAQTEGALGSGDPHLLAQWLANHVRFIATRNADQALEALEADEGQSEELSRSH